MKHTEAQTETWLPLSSAAEQLGVHPTTLRRWADQGEIQVMLTPGGHRRFALSELSRFLEKRQQLRALAGLESLWAERAIHHARAEVKRNPEFLNSFDEASRKEKRALGRELMELVREFLASDEDHESLITQARDIGRKHARQSRDLELPVQVALQAAMFFQEAAVESAMRMPDSMPIRPEVNLRLVRRINQLLNEVQLAIVEHYGSKQL
jgi:excisionase family DNA binding protein